jgi:hypothetical protein
MLVFTIVSAAFACQIRLSAIEKAVSGYWYLDELHVSKQ